MFKRLFIKLGLLDDPNKVLEKLFAEVKDEPTNSVKVLPKKKPVKKAVAKKASAKKKAKKRLTNEMC